MKTDTNKANDIIKVLSDERNELSNKNTLLKTDIMRWQRIAQAQAKEIEDLRGRLAQATGPELPLANGHDTSGVPEGETVQ